MLISKSLLHPHFKWHMQVCVLIQKKNNDIVGTEQGKNNKNNDYASKTHGDCHRTFRIS